uniref:Uncharacterized protein n=1 Tax=Opuntia streptacantha TaxID=393608 RepID=A0A7C9DUC0_OPUST
MHKLINTLKLLCIPTKKVCIISDGSNIIFLLNDFLLDNVKHKIWGEGEQRNWHTRPYLNRKFLILTELTKYKMSVPLTTKYTNYGEIEDLSRLAIHDPENGCLHKICEISNLSFLDSKRIFLSSVLLLR